MIADAVCIETLTDANELNVTSIALIDLVKMAVKIDCLRNYIADALVREISALFSVKDF